MERIALKELKIINDKIDDTLIVITIASDEQRFATFKRSSEEKFTIRNDSLISPRSNYDFAGRSNNGNNLQPVKSYQGFGIAGNSSISERKLIGKERETNR